jgi:5-methylthioadenosine/S-adenosylhomocysteine deaminase
MPLEMWLLHAVPPNHPQRSREEIRARVLIGALEALKSGITALQDMATVHPFDRARWTRSRELVPA